MINIKFLDLFAGIGGFRSGLEMAGHECVGFVEIDKFARKSYRAIYNTEGEWTAHDIRAVRASELPRADIWTFGFPCQDISVAGRQKGFAGKRSSLFFTVTGLIRDLEEKDRPSILLIENVKNLLSINGGWDFLKLQIELDEIGYDVEWDVLDTAEVLPQHRERVYIVGHFRGRRTRNVFPITRKGESIDSSKQKIIRVFDGRNAGTYGSQDVVSPDGIAGTLNTMGGGNREPKIAIQESAGAGLNQDVIVPVLTPDRLVKRQNERRFKTNGEPMFTLNTQDRHGVTDWLRIRKLTPLECWRLQGFTDEQFYKAQAVNSNSQLYKQAGNSVSVPVVYAVAKHLKINS